MDSKKPIIWTGDIEILINCFILVCVNYYTKETKIFEISNRKYELKELREFLRSIDFLITFNGDHFDNVVLNWMLDEKNDHLINERSIYKLAQIIINQENRPDDFVPFKKYKYNFPYGSIDLFSQWARMTRKNKKISLKTCAVSLNMDIVEMPYPHYTHIPDDKIDEVIEYCINDNLVTLKLAQEGVTIEGSKKEIINLRFALSIKEKQDFLSMDGSKIASELLLKKYCKAARISETQVRGLRTYNSEIKLKDIISPMVKFNTPIFQELLQYFRDRKVSSTKEIEHSVILKQPEFNIKLDYGSGGLHGMGTRLKFIPKEDEVILTSDVASLHPSSIINNQICPAHLNKKVFIPLYTEIRDSRIKAKKEGRSVEASSKKLILNSTYGLFGNEYSWLYDLKCVLATTLHGQLLLSKLIEYCYVNQITIISANTK